MYTHTHASLQRITPILLNVKSHHSSSWLNNRPMCSKTPWLGWLSRLVTVHYCTNQPQVPTGWHTSTIICMTLLCHKVYFRTVMDSFPAGLFMVKGCDLARGPEGNWRCKTWRCLCLSQIDTSIRTPCLSVCRVGAETLSVFFFSANKHVTSRAGPRV